MRSSYVRIKLPTKLMALVDYVVQHELQGYKSMTQFVVEATRDRIHQMQVANLVPPHVTPPKKIPDERIGR